MPSNAQALGGSLKLLMNELTDAERAIDAVLPDDVAGLDYNRWRPNSIEPPSLYHVLGSAPFQQLDTAQWRDTLNILARIAIPHEEPGAAEGLLEEYGDAFRQVMDPVLGARGRPLNGAALWAERTDMRTTEDEFGGVPYLCIEFLLQFRLERLVTPT